MIGEARCGPVSPATRHKTKRKKGANDTVRSSGLLMRLLGALCVIIMAMANPTKFRTAMITAATTSSTTSAPAAKPLPLFIRRSAAATDDLMTSTGADDANATLVTKFSKCETARRACLRGRRTRVAASAAQILAYLPNLLEAQRESVEATVKATPAGQSEMEVDEARAKSNVAAADPKEASEAQASVQLELDAGAAANNIITTTTDEEKVSYVILGL